MHFEVVYIPSAKTDLDFILEYLSQFYPSTPTNFQIAMQKCEICLSINPYMYPAYLEKPPYRKAVVENYLVFFIVDDGKHLVEIRHILPAKWDIPKYV